MKKQFLYLSFAFALSLFAYKVNATHIIGGELYYDQINDSTYAVTLKVYRDCYNGVPWFDTPARIKIFDENGTFLKIHYIYNYTYSQLDPYLDSLCIVIPPDVCVQEAIYTDIIYLPHIQGGYQMSYTRCCRNSTILNIIGPDTTGITIHTIIPETQIDSILFDTIQIELITIDSIQVDSIVMDTVLIDSYIVDTLFELNSNPRFNNFPPILICVDMPLIFDHAATDPDGDSIVYSMCEPLHGGNIPNVFGVTPIEAPPYNEVVWNPPYNDQDPLGGIPLSIDSNGELTGTPNTVGQFVVGVCATEYRDGVVLSVNRRDFQFNVLPCLPVPTAAIPANMLVCADSNNAVSFEIETILNAITFNWDFGDTTTVADTSSLQIPSYTYPDTGYYDIRLIVNEGYTCEDTGYATVYVQPGVEASFDYKNKCFPEGIQLDGAVVVHGGTLLGIEWLLESGISSTDTSLIYSFSEYGTYPVSFIAANNYGCADTVTQYVQQYESPIANFVVDTACFGDTTFVYSTSQSISSTIVQYAWQFGDGNTAFSANSINQYSSAGDYSVTLVVTNALSCLDTAIKNVTILESPQANFISTIGCVGDPTLLYDATSSQFPIISWLWLNDTNQIGITDQDAVFYFADTGVYNVQLYVENSFGCVDSISKLIDVFYDPIADFTYTNVCFGDTNYFQNQSTIQGSTIVGYQWLFDSNGSSPSPNPIFPFSQEGEHEVRLVVTSSDGCVDTSIQSVYVYYIPEADFSTQVVCLNDTVFFSDSSAVTGGVIDDWTWNFGNGQFSSFENPNTVYDTEGIYAVSLVVVTNQGCSASTSQTLDLFQLPQALFSYQNVCEGKTVDLIDQSISTDSIIFWNWGFSGINSSEQNLPNYQFNNYGSYPVQLIVETSNGCLDTAYNVIQIYPNPIANFTDDSDCYSDVSDFIDYSTLPQGAIDSWSWNFGDGTSSTDQNNTHTFPAYGSYTVQLIVETNNGCIDTVSQIISNLEPPTASYLATDMEGCTPLEITVSAVPISSNMQYQWEFSNGIISSDSVVNLVFEDPSTYGMTFYVTNVEGCTDTVDVTAMFTVYETPESSFEYSPDEASVYEPYFQFENLTEFPASSFQWLFGDDTKSAEYSPWHEYSDTGTYDVTLISSTTFGCADTLTIPVHINGNFFVYYIPNTFTPHRNSLNNIFNGKGIGVADYHMYIYNRWGELIFETTNKDQGWDGTLNGVNLQIGTYVYVIEIMDVLEKEHRYIGHVNLVR
ncbi:MAG: PKD domain-containing protein [Flavobacteriales bacterium]|nr:PKD domain-containing protein [Flavobacteriales bacterium]